MAYQVFDDRNIRREFFKALDVAEAGSWAQTLGMRVDSDRAIEEYKWLGSVPVFREWLGSRHEKRARVEAFTITNREYEATMELPLRELRRDKTGMINLRTRELATRASQHWEILVNDLIEIADTAAGLCYDGQQFFDTDHVSGASGTLSNSITSTEAPSASVVLRTAPTATEMSNIIVELIQHMYTFKDDVGEPINQNATQFMLMVPVPFMSATTTALSAQFLASGVTNVALANNFRITMLVNPRVDWTFEMALFRTDGQMMPFILQEEVPINTEFLGAGSEEAFKNQRHLFGIHASRAAGFGLWQHALHVTLDTT